MPTDGLSLQPVLERDKWFVDRVFGPDPLFDGVDAVALGLASTHVPHHVPAVLGVTEDVAHIRVGPAADGTLRAYRDRRRVGHKIEVEPVCDGLVAEALVDAPVVHLPHGGCLGGVRFEEGLLDEVFPFLWTRV
jgi:hypothetical protein